MNVCKHKKTEIAYGFAYSSGWRGVGGLKLCATCLTVLEFYDDIECCTPEEIEHNKKKREQQYETICKTNRAINQASPKR